VIMGHTHKDEDQWKRDRDQKAIQQHLRKITNQAENRMRSRTALAQLEEARRTLRGPDAGEDTDDASTRRGLL
jgi:hypothetical protein